MALRPSPAVATGAAVGTLLAAVAYAVLSGSVPGTASVSHLQQVNQLTRDPAVDATQDLEPTMSVDPSESESDEATDTGNSDEATDTGNSDEATETQDATETEDATETADATETQDPNDDHGRHSSTADPSRTGKRHGANDTDDSGGSGD